MKILYYKQFFTGPDAPGTQQPRALVRKLADRGHQVDVVACDFNAYNEQTEPEESYSCPDSGGSVKVHRIPSRRGLRRSLLARLRTYGGFALPALQMGIRLGRPDVVIASIQPLFTAWAARRVARWRGVPWLLEVRDLWPDALVVKGAISRRQALPLELLARSLYRDADRIVSVTPGIKLELVRKGIDDNKIDVFPNGFDPALFSLPPEARERDREQLGWGSKFIALFAGTHTEVTAVDVIIRAAAQLRHRTDIRFELYGYGQTKPAVMRLAKELGLDNVGFHDPVPKSRIPGLVNASDVCLMTLFESPLIHIYFENKLMDYMGSGKPILAAMGGQQAELILKHRAGRVVKAFDHDGLARLVAEAADHPEKLAELGANGQKLVRERLLLPDILSRYAQVVEAVAARRARGIDAWDPFR